MAAVAHSADGTAPAPAPELEPQDAVVFVGISLVLGIASRHLLRGSRVPYTVALLILGIALGSLEYGTSHGLGKIGAGIRLWANINPNLLLSVFLPALLFESSFAMEVHQIKKCIVQMLILAGPGVLISTFCLGAALKLTFPYGWNWKTSLLLGGLLSATDPVAVVALLKELGASKKLSTIIEGESLINDGTAIVVYQLFYRMVIGQSFNAGEIIKFLSQVTFGSVAVGLAFGIASVLWLGFIFNDTVIEIALTLAVSYIAFFTAQDGLEASGILTVMTLGIFYAAVAKTAFKGDSQQSLHHFWEMIAYIANTLIFILSGVVIAEGVLRSDHHFERHGASWGYLMLLYGFVLLSRVIVVGLLFPFLRYFGYGLDWKESIILGWSGLRGAVALSLAVTVKRASDNVDQSFIKPEVGTLFVFFTGGIVFLTLIVNGSTTQFLLQLLSMDKLSAAKIRILNYTRYEMLNKALEAFGDLGDDEELGNVDWSTVQRYITCLNDLGEGQVHPHDVSDSEHHLRSMNLSDIRVRLLNGVQAAYWEMLEEGRISQNTATLLMRSVDEAMDKVSNETLCDWKGLKANVQFPRYYRYLQSSRLPRRIVTYFTVERLETACYISAAFLRAHRIARRQLYDFIGDSEVASKVISESNNEGEEAKKFLEDVRVTFPQVLRVVKTKQVTFSILNHLSNYVQNLEKAGLLEQKEMLHLDDAVQTDLKKLLRNPPLVRMPKRRDLLDVHPLLGALPPAPREILEGATKEAMKISGITLYSEGSKPDGIWLISTGAVRWASKSLSNWHSLHPTFSHGSTMGLYEVLTGKPYICNTITDTVVHCFFIETEIIQALRSDPTIEDFLWQESAIVIAKILLPQIFEKMSMQEMRVLVAERSTMNSYARGELIESRPNFVFFLLEGFIRTQEAPDDLITSPAALLSSHIDLRFLSLELSAVRNASFCHMGSMFLVETTARVICFEAGSIKADAVLQKRLSSNILPSSETQRSLSASHGGLLSWPENLYKAGGQHQSSSEVLKEPTSLSAKAMQLSIYGSMSNNMHRRRGGMRSYARSLSYPRLPSKAGNTRPLISAKSEGGSVNRRLLSEESRKASIPPLPVRRGKAKVVEDDSSGESGGEEVIVQIDRSPHQTTSPPPTSPLPRSLPRWIGYLRRRRPPDLAARPLLSLPQFAAAAAASCGRTPHLPCLICVLSILASNNYQIGRRLGRGSSADVRLARHRVSGHIVALKCISKPHSHDVKREVRIMRRLHHPRILRFIEVLSSPTHTYIVLDLAKCGDLCTLLQKTGRFTEALARHYFHQLISAVAYCHSQGVFHCDLKLENLLLDDSGDLLLSDFGLASDAGPRTTLHTFCGTRPYMAPEILAGKAFSGAAADVWACGTILFVLTVGSFPSYDSRMECRGEYRCPGWMSEELRRLISRLLDPNPRTRATIEEIIDDPWFCQGLDKEKWEMMRRGYGDEVRGGWWRRLGSWWRTTW